MENLGIKVLFEGQNLARLLSGLGVVLQLSALSIFFSVVLGLVVGMVMTLPYRLTRFLTRVYLEFIRIMPQLVLLFLAYFGLTRLTGINLPGFTAAVLVFVFLQTIVTRTKVGMAMRAVSWDRFALPLMGIPLDSVIVVTFVLGSGIAGLGGMLFAMCYPNLEPYMGAMIGWKAFIAAVVGGIGDIRGAFVGGFLLAFVEIMVVAFLPSTYMDLFSFTILLLILWVRPTGIFGMPQTTKI